MQVVVAVVVVNKTNLLLVLAVTVAELLASQHFQALRVDKVAAHQTQLLIEAVAVVVKVPAVPLQVQVAVQALLLFVISVLKKVLVVQLHLLASTLTTHLQHQVHIQLNWS
jgi:hypothetical protein